MGEYNVLHTKQLSQVPNMSPLDEQHTICPSIQPPSICPSIIHASIHAADGTYFIYVSNHIRGSTCATETDVLGFLPWVCLLGITYWRCFRTTMNKQKQFNHNYPTRCLYDYLIGQFCSLWGCQGQSAVRRQACHSCHRTRGWTGSQSIIRLIVLCDPLGLNISMRGCSLRASQYLQHGHLIILHKKQRFWGFIIINSMFRTQRK